MKKTYCAISYKKKYRVCTIGPCGDFTLLGNVRSFETFDEANRVARDISAGRYGYKTGYYVNMR